MPAFVHAQSFLDLVLTPGQTLGLAITPNADGTVRVQQFLDNVQQLPQPFSAINRGISTSDFVGPQVLAPNGNADRRITLNNLKSTPTQILVQGNNGGIWVGPLNPAHWLVAAQYSGNSAEIYFEPYQNNTSFTVTITYADGSTDQATAN